MLFKGFLPSDVHLSVNVLWICKKKCFNIKHFITHEYKSVLRSFAHKMIVELSFNETDHRLYCAQKVALSITTVSISQTYFFIALRIFIDTPHCTQVLMGLGQPFPLTVMPSRSNLYAFTSVYMQKTKTDKQRNVLSVVKD